MGLGRPAHLIISCTRVAAIVESVHSYYLINMMVCSRIVPFGHCLILKNKKTNLENIFFSIFRENGMSYLYYTHLQILNTFRIQNKYLSEVIVLGHLSVIDIVLSHVF